MLLYTARQLRTRSPRSDKLRPNIPVTCSDNTIKTRARTHGFVTPLAAIIDCINNAHHNKEVEITVLGNEVVVQTTFTLDEAQAITGKQYCLFTCADVKDECKWTATTTASINNGNKFFIATRPITYSLVHSFSLQELLDISHGEWTMTIKTLYPI